MLGAFLDTPPNNIPYLFVAYAVTWFIFFVYVFLVSRRQQEMEQEIRQLRRALEGGNSEDEPGPL